MKIKHRFSISMAILGAIFVGIGIISIDIHQEISQVAEYHEQMSIPALSLLEQISTNSELMHRNIHGFALGHEHAIPEYDFHLQETRDLISEYEKLSYRVNPQNEYLATSVMQVQMQGFASDMLATLDRYDSLAQEFFSGTEEDNLEYEEIDQFFDKLNAEIGTLRDTLIQDKQMETLGFMTQQEKITDLRNTSDYLLIFMITVGITSAVLVPFLNSRWVSKNVIKIMNATDEISTGNLETRIDTTNSTDEFNEISKKINYMAIQLSDYQTKLVNAKKLETLGKLSANLAHDIRNPLSIIKNTMEVLKKMYGTDNKKQKQFERIEYSIRRISHQIDDVLEYVGFTPLQFTKKSIREILISSNHLISITDNITINFPDNDIEIECDDKKLERVFVNILLNAIQAIGSDKGSIDVRIRDKNDHIEIECENSGSAIDEENIHKIFEPLFTTKFEGTGLGLSSVQAILKSHEGTISVTSPPVIFTITLPKTQINI